MQTLLANNFARAGFIHHPWLDLFPLCHAWEEIVNIAFWCLAFGKWSLTPLADLLRGDGRLFHVKTVRKSRNGSCVCTRMHSSVFARIFSGNLLTWASCTPSSMHGKRTLAQLWVAPEGPDQWNERLGSSSCCCVSGTPRIAQNLNMAIKSC